MPESGRRPVVPVPIQGGLRRPQITVAAAAFLGTSLLLAALPASSASSASSASEVALAPPGPCATALDVVLIPGTRTPEDERDSEQELPPVSTGPEVAADRAALAAALDGAAGSPVRRLSPTDVALTPPLGGLDAPPASGFPGVGACDDPGSGCLGPLIPTPDAPMAPPAPAPPRVIGPPPAAPCGAPGFPCR